MKERKGRKVTVAVFVAPHCVSTHINLSGSSSKTSQRWRLPHATFVQRTDSIDEEKRGLGVRGKEFFVNLKY